MLNNSSKLNFFGLVVCLAGFFGQALMAQTPVVKPKPPVIAPTPPRERTPFPELPRPPEEPFDSSERALAVDPNVNIKLPCISQGRITINGWSRDEVRVFVRNGPAASFKVHEKDPKSGKPVWIQITKQPSGRVAGPFSECLSGDRVDIEVPFGSTVAMSGRETETVIDSVRKVNVKNIRGRLSLRNISGGIDAETYEGDVSVETSGGQINLKTSSGNIVAFDVSPGQVGDLFRAVTSSGKVTLQKVEHRQIEANSVTGTLLFNGKFLSGGIYKFKTSDGSMKIIIPQSTSCRVVAWYGFGEFKYDVPLEIETENVSEGGKTVRGRIGSGDATLSLTTTSGTISITKQ